MTNYSFLTVAKGDEFHSFNVSEIISYHIGIRTTYDGNIYVVTVVLQSDIEHEWEFDTMKEAKNSIRIIGDIRCQ